MTADRKRHEQVRTDPFEALADPTRRGILELLRDSGERTAGEIAAAFPEISRPAVSRHLRVLREAGLAEARQSGREWIYALRAEELANVYRAWLESFAPVWETALEQLKRQVEHGLASETSAPPPRRRRK